MGYRQHLGKNLKKKKLLQVWARGKLCRSWSAPQGSLLANSRLGMDIVLAHPPGYHMDLEVQKIVEQNCK